MEINSIVAQTVGAIIGGIFGCGAPGAMAGAAIGKFCASITTAGLDLADGQSWKHAGTQFGYGMVSDGAGVFSPIINGIFQGIEYEEDGDVSWSGKKARKGTKQVKIKKV